jgi:uncharacterized membrane protein
MTLWNFVLWLHLLGMALFVGGQLMLAVVVVPVLRVGDRTTLRAAARRFGLATLGAFVVLIGSGSAMASHLHRWSDSTLQVKLGLVGLVVLLALAHLRWPRLHALQGAILVASLVIVWLGLTLARG